MSGNKERPNKERIVKSIMYDTLTWQHAIPPERGDLLAWGLGKTCVICRVRVMNEEEWHEEHDVCMVCYRGERRVRRILTEAHVRWGADPQPNDDDAWVDDNDYGE